MEKIRAAKALGEKNLAARLAQGEQLQQLTGSQFFAKFTGDVKKLYQVEELRYMLQDAKIRIRDAIGNPFNGLCVRYDLQEKLFASPLFHEMLLDHLHSQYRTEDQKQKLKASYIKRFHSQEPGLFAASLNLKAT